MNPFTDSGDMMKNFNYDETIEKYDSYSITAKKTLDKQIDERFKALEWKVKSLEKTIEKLGRMLEHKYMDDWR